MKRLTNMLRHLNPWRQPTKEEILARIRAHFAFFGCDTAGLTDEELEAGLLEFGHHATRFGLPPEGAHVVFRRLANAGRCPAPASSAGDRPARTRAAVGRFIGAARGA